MIFCIVVCTVLLCFVVFSKAVLLTATSVAAVASILGGSVMVGELFGLSNMKCSMDLIECCGSTHVGFDKNVLYKSLHGQVYGQHLAIDAVYKTIVQNFEKKPDKALVMSFHGWTGVGKNYVTQKVVESIFKRGLGSSFVHLLNADALFYNEDQIDEYKMNIQKWILGNVTRCSRSVFIFDEADHAPVGLFDVLIPYLDRGTFRGVDFSNTIFIFLSNVGGIGIADIILELLEHGKNRTWVQEKEVYKVLHADTLFGYTGFQDSKLVETNRIDHFVPFFPLEAEHVTLCIRDAIEDIDPRRVNDTHVYKEVFRFLHWVPEKGKFFSNSGCKKLKQKTRFELKKSQWDGL